MADRPNILARSVAAARLSIRSKLLISYLGITALLAGLALFGLSTLEQAKARTEQLIRDQERFAYFTELYGFLSRQETHALAAGLDPEKVSDSDTSSRIVSGGRLHESLLGIEGQLGRSVRRFGGRESPDGMLLWSIRETVQDLKPVASKLRELFRAREFESAQRTAVEEFIPVARQMQRAVFTKLQEIEAEMADKAQTTARAYVQSRQQVIGIATAAIGLALLIGYAMSSALIWPVRRVGEVLHQVAGGRFAARVSVPNRDELGGLADNVNSMSERLGALYHEVEAQRAELADLNHALEDRVASQVEEIARTNRLRRFLPAQVADMIVGAPDQADVLRTRRAEITVLFADLRGFTAFAIAATPDQVVTALNTFHETCGPLVEESGGTLERFLGDGLMVLFGAPMAMDNAAQRAVDLALEMRAALRTAMAPFQSGADGRGLGVGIGIGTGAATLGQIGFEARRDYSAIGPAPNLAARLCERADAGQILISHATAWQVEAAMEPTGPFDLKGIGSNISAFVLEPRVDGA